MLPSYAATRPRRTANPKSGQLGIPHEYESRTTEAGITTDALSSEGIQQSAELAYDLATVKPEETATTSGGSDGEKHAPEPPRSFAERVRDSAAAMLHNERGMVPYLPFDPFDRMAAEWAQAPPPDEGLQPHDPPEPYTPERDGPDIQ